MPYADSELEMLYIYGRLLLPHLPADRDTTIIKVLNERFGTQFSEDLMIERMGENDRIVTRYMSD